MELSPFLKDKLTYLFHMFYDSNKNGIITHGDFLKMTKDIQKLRKWKLDDPELEKCEESLTDAWCGLKAGADSNRDQQVTLKEWFDYWSSFRENSSVGTTWPDDCKWVVEYKDFWFDIMDVSGDGVIDENEFVEMMNHFRVPVDEAKNAFRKLGCPQLDKATFGSLWLQYMTSDEKDVPASYIFGKFHWS